MPRLPRLPDCEPPLHSPRFPPRSQDSPRRRPRAAAALGRLRKTACRRRPRRVDFVPEVTSLWMVTFMHFHHENAVNRTLEAPESILGAVQKSKRAIFEPARNPGTCGLPSKGAGGYTPRWGGSSRNPPLDRGGPLDRGAADPSVEGVTHTFEGGRLHTPPLRDLSPPSRGAGCTPHL